ncbi:MAG: transposase [bacterium]
MARSARIILPGLPHHITQRGNHREEIFTCTRDYNIYKNFVFKYCAKYGVDIMAYCLMSNHIHLVAIPVSEESFSDTFRDINTSYSKYFNSSKNISGHIWHGRFYSCVMDEEHLWHAIRYVERNPVRAKIVATAAEYNWSSAATHCNKSADMLLSNKFPITNEIPNWTEWLTVENFEIISKIRTNTISGKPVGSKEFIDKINEMIE